MKIYVSPEMELIQMSVADVLTFSISGSAPDSDDSEFG